MWTNELKYFLAQDPRQFDFRGAYGNPGTPVLELGTLFHTVLGVSYRNAITLSVSVLVSLAVSACSVICIALQPASLWWLATACTLLLNRLSLSATPPTAIAMPLTALIVLATWWIVDQPGGVAKKYFLGWGAVVGLACATRIEVALLVSAPFSLLIVKRHGWRPLLPMTAGVIVIFFLADPYLWLMPVQHLTDIVRRFTINYAQYPDIPIFIDEIVYTLWLAALSAGWCIALLMRDRLPRFLPREIVKILIGISLIMFIVVFSSNYKPVRYFFPLTVVWEVILALLALEAAAVKVAAEGGPVRSRASSYLITGLLVFIQLCFVVAVYIYFH